MIPVSRFFALPAPVSPAVYRSRIAEIGEHFASSTRSLRVAVVYDDAAAGQRALDVLDRLERESTGQIRVQPVLWRFNRLAQLLNRCRAADDVLESDVIVLSVTARESTPPDVERWFNACLERKRGSAVLLLLSQDDDVWVITESKAASGGTIRQGT